MIKTRAQRLVAADFIRIFSIFLIIVIHNYKVSEIKDFWTLLDNILFNSLHIAMPLLVMISGALLIGREDNIFRFLKKRSAAVLIPWVFWVFFYYFVEQYRIVGSIYRLEFDIFDFYQKFMSRFWFLPMIFSLYLLTPAANAIVKNSSKKLFFYILGYWFFAFSILPFVYFLAGKQISFDSSLLRQTLQYSGFYLAGYLIVQRKFFMTSIKYFTFAVAASFLATVLISWVMLSLGRINTFFYMVSSPSVVIFVVSIFLFVQKTALNWEKKINERYLSYLKEISECCLGIYLIHEFATIDIVNRYFYRYFYLDNVLLKSVVVFILCLLIVKVIKKIKYIKTVV